MSGKKLIVKAKPASAARPKAKPPKAKKKMDCRALRTRDALGDALVDLMHERPFRRITVQDVLDRAGVSRSTFYTHYRDKNDLFLSDVEDFLELMAFSLTRNREVSKRVAPVRELFAHVAEWKTFHAVLVKAGKFSDFLALGQGYFSRAIGNRLKVLDSSLTGYQRDARAEMLAAALLSLLLWWLDNGLLGTPAEMDDLFHGLVWGNPGLKK